MDSMKALILFGAGSQRRFAVLAWFPVIWLTGSLEAQTSDPYEGSLDRSAARGTRIVEFSVPGNRPAEIGVIPKHLPFANYRGENGSNDVADEQELVRYDFYKPGTTKQDGAVAICPKNTSTSAAVDVCLVPDDTPNPARKQQRTAPKFSNQVRNWQNSNRPTMSSPQQAPRQSLDTITYPGFSVISARLNQAYSGQWISNSTSGSSKWRPTSASTGQFGKVGTCLIGIMRIRAHPQWHGRSSPKISSRFTALWKSIPAETSITRNG